MELLRGLGGRVESELVFLERELLEVLVVVDNVGEELAFAVGCAFEQGVAVAFEEEVLGLEILNIALEVLSPVFEKDRSKEELVSGGEEPTLLNNILNILLVIRKVHIIKSLLNLSLLNQQRILKYTAKSKELNSDIKDSRVSLVDNFLELAFGGEGNLVVAVLQQQGLLVAVELHAAFG